MGQSSYDSQVTKALYHAGNPHHYYCLTWSFSCLLTDKCNVHKLCMSMHEIHITSAMIPPYNPIHARSSCHDHEDQ